MEQKEPLDMNVEKKIKGRLEIADLCNDREQ